MSNPKGYVFAEIEVLDPQGYRADYVSRSTPAVEAFGGRFVVRGGEVSIQAGPDDGRRLVITEFPSYAQAQAFHDSELYAQARLHRDRHAIVHRFYIMEGA